MEVLMSAKEINRRDFIKRTAAVIAIPSIGFLLSAALTAEEEEMKWIVAWFQVTA
jgi:hypothetical protein